MHINANDPFNSVGCSQLLPHAITFSGGKKLMSIPISGVMQGRRSSHLRLFRMKLHCRHEVNLHCCTCCCSSLSLMDLAFLDLAFLLESGLSNFLFFGVVSLA